MHRSIVRTTCVTSVAAATALLLATLLPAAALANDTALPARSNTALDTDAPARPASPDHPSAPASPSASTGWDGQGNSQQIGDAGSEPDADRMGELARRMAGGEAGEASQPQAPDAPQRPNAADLAQLSDNVPDSDSDKQAAGDTETGMGAEPAEEAATHPNERQTLGPSDADPDAGEGGTTLEPTGTWLLNTLAALGVVIGLILLGRFIWARATGHVSASASPVVEVLSRTPVAPKNHVLLLRVGQRVLIVGDSPQGLRTLATVDEPQEIAELLATVTAARNDSVSGQFSQLLSRFNSDYESPYAPSEDGADTREHLFDRTRDSVSSLLARVRRLSRKEAEL